MEGLRRIIVSLTFVLGLVVATCQAKDATLAKFYSCTGKDPSGEQYQVYMETAAVPETPGTYVYRQWLPNGHVIVFGAGFIKDSQFVGTQWFGGQADQSAAMTYKVKGNKLDGTWMPAYDGKLYPEVCTAAKQTEIPAPVEQQEHPNVDSGQVKL